MNDHYDKHILQTKKDVEHRLAILLSRQQTCPRRRRRRHRRRRRCRRRRHRC